MAEPSKSRKWRRLALSSAILAAVCGIAAFLLLVLKDRKQPPLMVNELRAPAAVSSKDNSVAASPTQVSTQRSPASVGMPASSNQQSLVPPAQVQNQFTLSRTNHVSSLRPLRMKLVRTDSLRGLYDVNVIVGRRSFAHRRLKVNEPVWISISRSKGAMQMLVNSVRSDAVSGYWTISDRSAQVNSHHSNQK